MRSRLTLSLTLLLACTATPQGLFGYAGEQGAAKNGLMASTHHTHLTRALAYCAGLPGLVDVPNPLDPLLSQEKALLAETIAINDELTDQGSITSDGVTWTNINTDNWSYTLPTGEDLGCAEPKMVYPILSRTEIPDPIEGQFFVPSSGWFTNRFGPWAPFFHFPESEDLTTMHNFAFASEGSQSLEPRGAYGFGQSGTTAWTGACYKRPVKPLTTGKMKAGTVEAFATYLHSVGDHFSHGICRENWAGRQAPTWYFHTVAATQQVDGCAFNAHSFEFGCPETTQRKAFVQGTVDGGMAVYDALIEYAKVHKYVPLLSETAAHRDWLRRQIERYALSFKTNVSAAGGQCRVAYTYALMLACGDAAKVDQECLPDVPIATNASCSAEGQTGCSGGTNVFPLTPACTPPAKAAKVAP